jgi:hypothetical protein
MDEEIYLRALLAAQELKPQEERLLVRLKDTVQARLSRLTGSPVFYYAGSFAKNTIIRERFDLDIVVYWPPDCGYTLRDIYTAVGKVLRAWRLGVTPKTVAWHVPITAGFYIDVVPGRAVDNTYYYANLYRRPGSWIQTSIKKHIKTVRDSGRCDVIRLMKLWRVRKRVPIPKSLLLELLTLRGCSGCRFSSLASQMNAALEFIRDCIMDARIEDPANANNIISDEMTRKQRLVARLHARKALEARTWNAVFAPRPATI